MSGNKGIINKYAELLYQVAVKEDNINIYDIDDISEIN